MELTEQTLEQILARQREEYQRFSAEQREEYQKSNLEQREEFQRFNLEQRKEFQLFVGAAVEEFKSHVKQVAEGQDVLREQFERKQTELQQTQTVLASDLGSALREVSATLKGVQQELATLGKMVRKNTEDIEMMRADIEIIKADLSIIRSDLKQKVGRDEMAVLEARVAKLEMSQRSGRI